MQSAALSDRNLLPLDSQRWKNTLANFEKDSPTQDTQWGWRIYQHWPPKLPVPSFVGKYTHSVSVGR